MVQEYVVSLLYKIYVAALNSNANAKAIIKTPTANRVLMHFVYNEVTKKKIDAACVKVLKAI